jgi:phage terminase large subunit-like protein
MTTAIATRSKSRRAKSASSPSLGPVIRRWWREAGIVHAQGDYYGQPFVPRDWQVPLIDEMYELNADGTRRYDRVVVGYPKGQGKTELAALVAVTELAGPVQFAGWNADGSPRGRQRISPDVPVAAASFEQANHVFAAATEMVKGSRLVHACEVYDTEILLRGQPGRLYRVAAAVGTNDGGKPTFWVADELHEWVGTKERVHLVLENNRRKRKDAWQLAITTAGWDTTSLLGKLYAHGRRVLAGEVEDPGFLFRWHEANGKWDLRQPEELAAAVREANPAVGDFLPLEPLLTAYALMPEFEFRRYHLNQWVSTPERWLPVGAWDAVAQPGAPPPAGTPIMLGFDGSYAGDSTAIVGSTIGAIPRLFVIAAWEKPAAAKPDWRVDILDVEAAVEKAFATWKVQRAGCDPYRWQRSIAVLRAKFGEDRVLEWPSHQASHMVPACAAFYEATINKQLAHDGDPRFAQHVNNCIVKIDHRGPRITKDHKDSPRKIDIAVAGVIAHDLVVRERNAHKPSVYETRGILEL